MEELSPQLRTFVQMYAWRRIDPVPWAPVIKSLAESRVGLVFMACMVTPKQQPFTPREPDFDASLRIVASDTDPRTLVNTYPEQAFDHSVLAQDPNVIIPLDRLREMAAAAVEEPQ